MRTSLSLRRIPQPDPELLTSIPTIGSGKKARLIFEKPQARTFIDALLSPFRRLIQRGLARERVEGMLKITQNNASLSEIESVKTLQSQLERAGPFTAIGSRATQSAIIDLMLEGASLEPEFNIIFENYISGLKDHCQQCLSIIVPDLPASRTSEVLDILMSFAMQPNCPISVNEKATVESYLKIVNQRNADWGDEGTDHCGMPYADAFIRILQRYDEAFKDESRIVEYQGCGVWTPSQELRYAPPFKELEALIPAGADTVSMANRAVMSFRHFLFNKNGEVAKEEREALSDFLNIFGDWLPKLSRSAQELFLPEVVALEDALLRNRILKSSDFDSIFMRNDTREMVSALRDAGLRQNGISPSVANALIHYLLVRESVTALEDAIAKNKELVSRNKEKKSELLTRQLTRRAATPSLSTKPMKQALNDSIPTVKIFTKKNPGKAPSSIAIALPKKTSPQKKTWREKKALQKKKQQHEKEQTSAFSAASSSKSTEKILEANRSKLRGLEEQLVTPANLHLLAFAALNSRTLLDRHFAVLDHDDESEKELRRMMAATLDTLKADLDRYARSGKKNNTASGLSQPAPASQS